jgi:hypothetical protein
VKKRFPVDFKNKQMVEKIKKKMKKEKRSSTRGGRCKTKQRQRDGCVIHDDAHRQAKATRKRAMDPTV